ncbi:MAG TPA: AI-2E family transporter [Bryobacteraceae bacterium]|nr:AI-2E family transporter [Bryobacteraceae bacterium]
MANSSPSCENGYWFTRERLLTVTLALVTFLALYVCYLIVKPFIAPIAFALALGVATHAAYCWIRSKTNSKTLAAAIGVVLVALLIVIPVASISIYAANQLANNLDEVKSGELITKLQYEWEKLPISDFMRRIGSGVNFFHQAEQLGGALAGQLTAFLRGSLEVLTQMGVMLFVLFFLYRDQESARAGLLKLLPLSDSEASALFRRVSDTLIATVNGSLTVAAVQATLAGAMYLTLGVPLAVLWAAATFFAALVPVFGTMLIWMPVTVYLFLSGQYVKALILIGWSALVVGTIDNILYPTLVGDRLRMHTVLTFFSIVGGIALFGPSGLILGPLALAVTVALLEVWWERTKFGQAAEKAVAETALHLDTSPAEVLQQTESART